jgi:hypothetical protein
MYTRNITEQMFMLIEGETFLLLNRTFFYKYNRMEKKVPDSSKQNHRCPPCSFSILILVDHRIFPPSIDF